MLSVPATLTAEGKNGWESAVNSYGVEEGRGWGGPSSQTVYSVTQQFLVLLKASWAPSSFPLIVSFSAAGTC